ncbi:MAG: globin domain-containing protein [Rhodothermales bacterium]
MSNPHTETIHRSLKRCNRNPRFLDIFYEKFLSSSPEVRDKFSHTDMDRQKRMVEASLFMSILASDGVPYAASSIERLGEMHGNLGVQPAFYNLWLDALIDTIAECDNAFDDDVETAWREVMHDIIAMMLTTSKPQE